MAIMPGATLHLLPENETQKAITPTQLIFHTAADNPGPTRLWKYFGQEKVRLESHFWVPNSGEIIQMMDTNIRADANRHANGRAISIETEDDGDPVGNPWTPAQVEALIRITQWCHSHHGIPMQLCPAHNKPGVGWHSQWNFPDDPRGQTGKWVESPWTKARGKTCPGKTRITQLVNEILPKASSQTPKGPPMTTITDVTPPQMTAAHMLQKELNDAGYDVGAVDGEPGPRTLAGLRRALQDNRTLASDLRRAESAIIKLKATQANPGMSPAPQPVVPIASEGDVAVLNGRISDLEARLRAAGEGLRLAGKAVAAT